MLSATRAIMKTYTTTIYLGKKAIQKLIVLPKPYKKKQNNHGNDNLLKKQEESQLLFVAKNKRSSNLTPFCSKTQKEPNFFFLKKKGSPTLNKDKRNLTLFFLKKNEGTQLFKKTGVQHLFTCCKKTQTNRVNPFPSTKEKR
jgi:hypothetical protein